MYPEGCNSWDEQVTNVGTHKGSVGARCGANSDTSSEIYEVSYLTGTSVINSREMGCWYIVRIRDRGLYLRPLPLILKALEAFTSAVPFPWAVFSFSRLRASCSCNRSYRRTYVVDSNYFDNKIWWYR
ncbi:hypothetical protein KM043_015814 [Ampulex compressa]|nr:hypothetical protein KM043_015814 [Ampulex compressa]